MTTIEPSREYPPGTVAVIGAGIAGAVAATMLAARGTAVTVFDKGRGPGGRAATRRTTIGTVEHAFDHGAQYFTVRDERFAETVRQWCDAGFAVRWGGRVVRLTPHGVVSTPAVGRFVGVPGMSALARRLLESGAAPLDVAFGHRAVGLTERRGAWHVAFDDGRHAGPFDRVIVAIPAPQAATLLAPVAPAIATRIRAVRMLPCWTAMLAFETLPPISFEAAFVDDGGSLGWIARNGSKPARAGRATWVAQARHDWSLQNVEAEPSWVVERLGAELFECLGIARAACTWSGAHRWRYAIAEDPIGTACLADAETRLIACGDWCLGPRIEAAYRSGVAAAEHLLGESPRVGTVSPARIAVPE